MGDEHGVDNEAKLHHHTYSGMLQSSHDPVPRDNLTFALACEALEEASCLMIETGITATTAARSAFEAGEAAARAQTASVHARLLFLDALVAAAEKPDDVDAVNAMNQASDDADAVAKNAMTARRRACVASRVMFEAQAAALRAQSNVEVRVADCRAKAIRFILVHVITCYDFVRSQTPVSDNQ